MKLLRKNKKIGEDVSCQFPLESWYTVLVNEWDFLPNGRNKIAEGSGVVCPFKINIPDDSPFTGVLGPGKRIGIARLSPETNFYNPITPVFYPAMSLKIFR